MSIEHSIYKNTNHKKSSTISRPEINIPVLKILSKYKVKILKNRWRIKSEDIESDIQNMNYNDIVKYFLETWVNKHIIFLDSKELYKLLLKNILLINFEKIRKVLFNNNYIFVKTLLKTQNWTDFLFGIFEQCKEKEKIPPYLQIKLMHIDQEKYFNIIKNNQKIKNKILKSWYRSPYNEIKEKLIKKED